MPYCKFQDDTESQIKVWAELDNLAVTGLITIGCFKCHTERFSDYSESQIKVWIELDNLAV